jgi:pimeloyl-ACP methyl ester carboxylesterase
MKRNYVNTPEGQIHYQSAGSGEAILLLHKTPLSFREYSAVMPILAEKYHVVAMDTMGYGESDAPSHEYGIEEYSRSVANFLDALDIKKTNIVGFLTGSVIAVEVAAAYPHLVDKLILGSCPYNKPEVRQTRLKDPFYQYIDIKEDGSHLLEIWNRYRLPQTKPESLQLMVLGYLMAEERAEDAHLSVMRYNIEERLPLIKSPTLLVTGGSSDKYHGGLETLAKLIPLNRTRIIEGGGGYMPLEKPQEFAQAILDFLNNPGI